MSNNNLTDSFEFDFNSFDESFNSITSIDVDNTINEDEFDDLTNLPGYNDTLLCNKDTFDVGNLKNSDYNKDTIDEQYKEKPSEKKKYLNNIDTDGDKKTFGQIEYTNSEYSGDTIDPDINLFGEFYNLKIDDYPNRKALDKSSEIKYKSLGANDTNFITKIIDKIKSILAR